MSTWAKSLDLITTYSTLAIAFAYTTRHLWLSKGCQLNSGSSEVIVGKNLAKGLALVEKNKSSIKGFKNKAHKII